MPLIKHSTPPDPVKDLVTHLRTHRDEINLAAVSRRAGYDSQYLKHIVQGRRSFTVESAAKVRAILEEISITPEGNRCH